MYISKILIVGSKNTRTRKILETSLKELGYFVNYKNSNGIIYIGNLSKKILLKLLNNKAKIIIFVDTNGEYVIPLTGEERGGSIIGGIIADILNAQLILTSKFSEKGLISIKEF
ncbi:MAG: cobalamin biosynthesis protein CbiG, partial [Sulfolobales archaeon]